MKDGGWGMEQGEDGREEGTRGGGRIEWREGESDDARQGESVSG